jgi:hypothetical protein
LKGFFYDMLGIVGILLLLGAAAFVLFYFTRGDVTIELGSIDNFPLRDGLDDGDAQSLTIVTLLPKDAIPAILDPQFASPVVVESQMQDTEPVIGVALEGEARAYPINMLSRHEIVNDVVGGEPIAVTW